MISFYEITTNDLYTMISMTALTNFEFDTSLPVFENAENEFITLRQDKSETS